VVKADQASGKSLWVIILVFFFASLTSCIYLKQRLGIGEYSLKAAIKWARADSARVADSLMKVRLVQRPVKESVVDTLSEIRSVETRSDQTSAKYLIIAGSFSSHEHALEIESKFRQNGFMTSIVPYTNHSGGKVEMISVGIFADKDEAREFLKDFKEKYNPDAWIFSPK
jgi:hypothetical protein